MPIRIKAAMDPGVRAEGSYDGWGSDPNRAQRISDTISRGFDVNQNQVDVTSTMSTPGSMTPAVKLSEVSRLRKIAFPSEIFIDELVHGVDPGTSVELNYGGGHDEDAVRERPSTPTQHAALLRQRAAELRKHANLGVSAPVAPPKPPSIPKASVKPVKVFDPRTDKPEGMNLMHGVQTVSNGADVGNSYSSFARRLQGSPI